MTKRNIFTICISLVIIATAAISIINYRYILDTAISISGSATRSFTPHASTITILGPDALRGYTKTYKNLPREFMHAGNFLIYQSTVPVKVSALAAKAISYTTYYKSYQLEQAIRTVNGIHTPEIAANKPVFIPYPLPPLKPDTQNHSKPAMIECRGLYYTGTSIANERILALIPKYRAVGINTIVFDVKDITGTVTYYSSTPMAQEFNTHEKRSIDDIEKVIRTLKSQGIYVIARIALFQDILLYEKNPKYAIHSKSTGGLWYSGCKEKWLDPTNREVQDYNIGLAIEMAEKGVDEVQFDYVRFPTGGNTEDAIFAYSFGKMSREAAIEHFLARARAELNKRNTNLSVDIFGVVAWGQTIDIYKTGQKIELLSKHCDALSPMVYPSHFEYGFDGFARPGDEPKYFIYTGCIKVRQKASHIAIRPWLQAFKWRVSNYNESYIIEQIKAADAARTHGYLFWSASNNYETVYNAMKIYAATAGERTALRETSVSGKLPAQKL